MHDTPASLQRYLLINIRLTKLAQEGADRQGWWKAQFSGKFQGDRYAYLR